ncbi:MAG: 16S rRNA (adenine(1518)-N(6)/adenine(1519)-N(6))-dimethyltransferase RsmA [Caldimicrobium sp.]
MILRLKKSLGQHLLISSGVLNRIAEYAQLSEGEVVVEIGPGTGLLTKALLKYPITKLYLIELDTEMLEYLQENIKDERVVLIQADATTFNYQELGERKLKVLGNLPYNVASLIVENLIYFHSLIPLALFLVQKEVAEKWLSGKSWLSIFIQTFYELEYLMTVPPRFFKPQPKVDSALIRFKQFIKKEITDLKKYKKFLTALYQYKRKMLRKKFPEELLRECNLANNLRAEDLKLTDIFLLYEKWLQYS